MVYTQSRIPLISVPEIIEESINNLAGIKRAYSVCPPLAHQLCKCLPCLGPEQCIIHPTFWFIHIQFSGHHIIVSCQYHLLPGCDQFSSVQGKPLKPLQLIIKFWPW